METRVLGKTGLSVSVLRFGCGAVGGLMVKGTASDQERAVARAMEFGINYFDTAPMYGNGESERNFGRVLRNLNRPKVYVGTKVWLEGTGDIARSIADSLEASLRRLGQDSVDLYQLHNPITFSIPAPVRRCHPATPPRITGTFSLAHTRAVSGRSASARHAQRGPDRLGFHLCR